MKRLLSFLSLSLVLLLLSCNLQMPNAVQIKGSPNFHFSAKFDIGKYLKDLFKGFEEENDNVVLLDCEKTSVVTYLVYMKLYDEKIPLDAAITGGAGDFTVPAGGKKLVPASGDYEKLEVPAFDFGDYLNNFSFNQDKIVSKLYVSGSEIVNVLSVELKIKNKTYNKSKENHPSGLKEIKNTYDKISLPEGGFQIVIPFDGNAVEIEYSIFIESGEIIKKEWMNDPYVLIELAVWLPFELIAKHEGAELKLPEDLFPTGDLFGRESPDSGNTVAEMLESLNFAMKMNTNPFTGVSLNIESGGIKIINPVKGSSLEFALNEQNMKAINSAENFPFTPKLKLVFNKDGKLSFPRNFIITEIAFGAKLNHTIDISGNGN